jgi:hypothetical protein
MPATEPARSVVDRRPVLSPQRLSGSTGGGRSELKVATPRTPPPSAPDGERARSGEHSAKRRRDWDYDVVPRTPLELSPLTPRRRAEGCVGEKLSPGEISNLLLSPLPQVAAPAAPLFCMRFGEGFGKSIAVVQRAEDANAAWVDSSGGPAASLQLPPLQESLHGQRKDFHAGHDLHTEHRMDAPCDEEVTPAPGYAVLLLTGISHGAGMGTWCRLCSSG